MIKLNVGDVVKYDSAAAIGRTCKVVDIVKGMNAAKKVIDWIVLEYTATNVYTGKDFLTTVRLAYIPSNMAVMNVRKAR